MQDFSLEENNGFSSLAEPSCAAIDFPVHVQPRLVLCWVERLTVCLHGRFRHSNPDSEGHPAAPRVPVRRASAWPGSSPLHGLALPRLPPPTGSPPSQSQNPWPGPGWWQDAQAWRDKPSPPPCSHMTSVGTRSAKVQEAALIAVI